MRFHSQFLVRAAACATLMAALAACDTKTTSGDGLCSLLGPCATSSSQPLDISYVIGFPDSLVSKDPTNQVGVLAVGDSVVLHYVHPGPVPAGQYAYSFACGSTNVVRDSLRWAVSDSSAAAIVRPAAGTAVVRARSAGRFAVLTTVVQSAIVPPQLWIAGVVACPSGRIINSIDVVGK
jgi:hypothetical protein